MSTLFNRDIKFLKGVGERRAKLYKKLGITSVGALLYFYPRAYEDWTSPVKISQAVLDETCCIKAKLTSPFRQLSTRSGLRIYTAEVSDGRDILTIKFFNNAYAAKSLQENKEYCFCGKISGSLCRKEMLSPDFGIAENSQIIKAVYQQTAGLSSKMISTNMKYALKLLPEEINDTLPLEIREKYSLCPLKDAIENIHFPESEHRLKAAQKRMIFDEFLSLQLGMMKIKNKKSVQTLSTKIKYDYSSEFFEKLPFAPTKAQVKAVAECIHDMRSDKAMNRLIQGDVGSGKTAVAAALCYTAVKNSMQCAFMVPTEILAVQHFNSLSKQMKGCGINIALLTSSTKAKEKRNIYESLELGCIDIVVGTHSLLNEGLYFKRLGLVITDEQHRFGVSQRTSLSAKGEQAHVLVMSATPIPRTLALMLYGDLDISVLDELPAGRQKIETYWIDSKKQNRALNFIKKQLDMGRQAYIVCPLLEENESELASAREYFENLQTGCLASNKLALIHGKMRANEKNVIMNKFLNKEIDVLVATTVVEVGLDVPNATAMMILNAERFGLSQLHQLRGRVGRGKYKSYCILVSDSKSNDSKVRLSTMCKTNDGFEIADEDLKLRGPGDFFGSRQHGLLKLKIANLSTDTRILKQAQEAALCILKEDPLLLSEKYKALRASVKRLFSQTGFILN